MRELVQSAASGNTLAFHQLADHYQVAVFRLIYHRVRSQLDAEDLTQDVFLKAYRNLHKLKAPDRFRNWLFSIALNRVRDFIRQQKLRRLFGLLADDSPETDREPMDPDAPDGFEQAGKRQFWETVTSMLAILSATEREVFILRFLDQLAIAEIAAVLQKSESTIKTHLYRAMAKFKAHPASAMLTEVLP